MHEFGHAFGGLWDEYWNGITPAEYPNMTKNNNSATVKWHQWIGYKNVGVYPFAASEWDGNPNQATDPWYRPHQSCIMRQTSNPFCPVCIQALLDKMEMKTGVALADAEKSIFSITQGNILYDKLKTKIIATGKINSSITIPETVTEINPYAFEGNSNLTTVHISNSADIGIHAFANCENLETVYFYSYNVPEIGTSAFTGDNFTVYVPYSKQAAYNVVFQSYLARIESLPITITFVNDGVEINTINTYFGATINTLGNTPIKQGYDFAGWYDNVEYTGIKYELMDFLQYMRRMLV